MNSLSIGEAPDKDDDDFGGKHGAHAMLCVGYSDADKLFIVRNSWGTNWGDKGYCYFEYEHLMNPKINHNDSWVIRQKTDLDEKKLKPIYKKDKTILKPEWHEADEIVDENNPIYWDALIIPSMWDVYYEDWDGDEYFVEYPEDAHWTDNLTVFFDDEGEMIEDDEPFEFDDSDEEEFEDDEEFADLDDEEEEDEESDEEEEDEESDEESDEEEDEEEDEESEEEEEEESEEEEEEEPEEEEEEPEEEEEEPEEEESFDEGDSGDEGGGDEEPE